MAQPIELKAFSVFLLFFSTFCSLEKFLMTILIAYYHIKVLWLTLLDHEWNANATWHRHRGVSSTIHIFSKSFYSSFTFKSSKFTSCSIGNYLEWQTKPSVQLSFCCTSKEIGKKMSLVLSNTKYKNILKRLWNDMKMNTSEGFQKVDSTRAIILV